MPSVSHLIAVTTCVRPGGASYLRETIASLGAHPLIFDDVNRMGARWNTWRALEEGGHYDRLLLFQDDVIAEPDLVARMLYAPIPDDVGFITYHDCGDDIDWQPPQPGVHKFAAHRFGSQGLCGAQCLLIPGDHARWLAGKDMNACPKPGPHGADYAIGWWTQRSPRPWKLIVSPSPVRHIGERSACHDDERRAAGCGIPHAGQTLEDFKCPPSLNNS